MEIIWFFLLCKNTFSELVPEDLDDDERAVRNLLVCALRALPVMASVERVRIQYNAETATYDLEIGVLYRNHSEEWPGNSQDMGLTVEGLVNQALRELFTNIENADYPGSVKDMVL